MKDAATALAALLERLGRFFDIFDLSFIVSGATSVGAIAFILHVVGLQLPSLSGWLAVGAILLSSYVAGLLCFAAGRWMRLGTRWPRARFDFDLHFDSVLSGHGLKDVPEIVSYLSRSQYRGIWRLYVRFWAEARHAPALTDSVALLNRYWVMAATYDGMAVALLTWILATIVWAVHVQSWVAYVTAGAAVVVLILMVAACLREAARYVYYQVEELVAAIAARRGQWHQRDA